MSNTSTKIKASDLKVDSKVIHNGMHKVVVGVVKTKLSIIVQFKSDSANWGGRLGVPTATSRVVMRHNDELPISNRIDF